MKKWILLTAVAVMLPLCSKAQSDDMYFSTKKSADKKEAAPSKKHMPVRGSAGRHVNDSYGDEGPTYYCGSNRDVDEYNRRGRRGSYYQKINADSLGNDIVTLDDGRGVFPDTIYVESRDVNMYDRDYDDFMYDRYYTPGYRYSAFFSPWFYSPRWYYGMGWYDPWYSSYYYGWYDPWYTSWGWGYPCYGGWYGGWGCHPYWGGWYGPSMAYSYYGSTGTSNHGATRSYYGGAGSFNGYRGTTTSASKSATTVRRSSASRNGNFNGSRSTTPTSRNDVFNTPSRTYNNSSMGSGSFGGGSFGGGRSGGGSFSGGGGGRSGGGSFGGRR